ncbi:hypothetical protein O181_002488 [Austropuccinia psidii MF-1]|uniref:Uncharacterized protein n=1 Tax=Austropuccinia psidii MF-1 TaxID=1389203 RepID=A0A9Q3GCP1_9BASI|nr:hypothetical protein [Austropuccinia psidii MF-1]
MHQAFRVTMKLFLASLALSFVLLTTQSRPGKPDFELTQPSSHYAILASPSSGQRLMGGERFQIAFFSDSSGATAAQFGLANSTGFFVLLHNVTLIEGKIKISFTLPHWVANGNYDFIALENNGQINPNSYTDVVMCSVVVGSHSKKSHIAPAIPAHRQPNQKLISEKREPHPPKFSQPTSSQSLYPGKKFHIIFTDGELTTSQARFVLRRSVANTTFGDIILTNASSHEPVFNFTGYTISANALCPESVSSGTYKLVAQEVLPQAINNFEDVASIDVKISRNPREHQITNHAQKTRQRKSFSDSSRIRWPEVEKREPHLPFFRLPTKDQTIVAGEHFNVSFVDGERSSDRVRFVFKSLNFTSTDHELVLHGKNSSADGFLGFNGFGINTRLTVPQGVSTGSYSLVAQEVDAKSKIFDAWAIQVKLVQRQAPIGLSSKADQAFPHLASSETSDNVSIETSLSSSNRLVKARKLERKAKSTDAHQSPIMVEPSSNQLVPFGSQFRCKVKDPSATTEKVRFYLRAHNGAEFYLGSATFAHGVAAATVTCPKNIRLDTYGVLVRENSLKRPQVFLDVAFTSIIVSHAIEDISRSNVPSRKQKRDHPPAELVKPSYNQNIRLGGLFLCQLARKSNAFSSDHIKFCLRFDNGDPDLQVGEAQMHGSLAEATCQIPSSIIPGTYEFIAQTNSPKQINTFSDVDSTTITLTASKGWKRNLPRSIVPRSFLSDTTANHFTSPEDAFLNHSSQEPIVLLKPTSYQQLLKGKGFDVRLKSNAISRSTMLKFFIRPVVQSGTTHDYELGLTSNANEVEESLECPNSIKNGTYLFVIQANDPDEPVTFKDSVFVPVVISDKLPVGPETASLPLNSTEGTLTPSSLPNSNLSSSIPSPLAPKPLKPTLPISSRAPPAGASPVPRSSTQLGSVKHIFTSSSLRNLNLIPKISAIIVCIIAAIVA